MSYGNLIQRAFGIVVRRPYLWLLGFLAGGATGFNLSSPSSGRRGESGTYHGPTWAAVQNVWNHNWIWIVAILACLALLGIVLFALGSIATGGIIHAAVEHDEDRPYRLATAWRSGYATGWRIAGLRLLTFLLAILPGLLVSGLVVAAVVSATGSAAVAAAGFGLLAALAALCAFAFWLALSVAYQLAQRLVVLEDGHVADSLSHSFRMIRWRFKEVALGWLILLAVSIGAGIAMAVLGVVLAIPAIALGFAGWATGGTAGLIVLGSVAAVYALGILLAAAAAYSAFSSVYWTLLFRGIRALPEPAARGAIVPAA
jgi:hypothetical protein